MSDNNGSLLEQHPSLLFFADDISISIGPTSPPPVVKTAELRAPRITPPKTLPPTPPPKPSPLFRLEKMDTLVSDVGKHYKKRLQGFLAGNPQTDELTLAHFYEESRKELLVRISEELSFHYTNAKKKCEVHSKKFQQHAKLHFKDSLEEYHKAMTEAIKRSNYLDEDRKTLHERHREEKAKACRRLHEACPPSSPDPLKEECVDRLSSKIDKSFAEILERFETLKSLTEKQMIAIFKSTKEVYHQRMRKNFASNDFQFVPPPELKSSHEKIVDELVDKYLKPGREWTDAQRVALKRLYLQAFRAYDEDNDMLLNNAGAGGVSGTQEQAQEPAIGIDVGYLNCYVAVYINGKSTMIQNEHGAFSTPAYVALDQDGTRRAVVGQSAKANASLRPHETIFDLKRMIGKLYLEYKVERDLEACPFSVVQEEEDGSPRVDVNGTRYYPEQIYAALLDELRKQAEFQMGRPMSKVVITAPAYFSEHQREAMKTAGELVGLDVLNVLSEPRAAILAYKLHRVDSFAEKRKVVVFNLERSSFDVTVFNVDANGMTVLAVDGDRKLGTENFDLKLLDHCVQRFKETTSIDLRKDLDSDQLEKRKQACHCLEKLYAACETQKEALSFTSEVEVRIDKFYNNKIDLQVPVSRDLFEKLNAPTFDKIMSIVGGVLESAHLKRNQVDNVILTGGGTKSRKIIQMLSSFFAGKTLNNTIDPTEVVVRGAAVHAAILNGALIRRLSGFS